MARLYTVRFIRGGWETEDGIAVNPPGEAKEGMKPLPFPNVIVGERGRGYSWTTIGFKGKYPPSKKRLWRAEYYISARGKPNFRPERTNAENSRALVLVSGVFGITSTEFFRTPCSKQGRNSLGTEGGHGVCPSYTCLFCGERLERDGRHPLRGESITWREALVAPDKFTDTPAESRGVAVLCDGDGETGRELLVRLKLGGYVRLQRTFEEGYRREGVLMLWSGGSNLDLTELQREDCREISPPSFAQALVRAQDRSRQYQ